MTASILENKPLSGNRELKLALTHIRMWFLHHNLKPEDLTIRVDFTSREKAQNARAVFQMNLDPEDGPMDFLARAWDYNGMKLSFDCTIERLAEIIKAHDAERILLHQQIATLRKQLEELA